MKLKHYTFLVIAFSSLSSCNRETTLQITDVKATPDSVYESVAQRFLGRRLNIACYDKSVKVVVEGQPSHVLRLYHSGDYLGESYSLTLFKKYGVIDSVLLSIQEYPKNPPPFNISITLMAKPQ